MESTSQDVPCIGRTHGAGCGTTLAALRRSLGAACHRAASAWRGNEDRCRATDKPSDRVVIFGIFPMVTLWL